MKKIQEIRDYLNKESPNKARDIIWIIKTILNIPMILIHELCHILAIVITGCKANIDPKKWYFISRRDIPYINTKGEEKTIPGLGFSFPIALSCQDPYKLIIVGAAPVLGILIDIFLCFWIPFSINISPFGKMILFNLMINYFVINFGSAWLSEDDINTIKTGWKEIKPKILSKIEKIKKFFVYLHQ